MKVLNRTCLLLAVVLAFAPVVHAQYTGNFQTNVINFTDNWSGDYFVGSTNAVSDALEVVGGGLLSDTNGWVGDGLKGAHNSVVVNDSGSVWTNSGSVSLGSNGPNNSLTITNGGVVIDADAYIGNGAWENWSSNNWAWVTGAGSLWTNSSSLSIGTVGPWNLLVISNGGSVVDAYGNLGDNDLYEGSNTVVVTGAGSLWTNSSQLLIGAESGIGNRLVISNGGSVFAVNVGFGGEYNSAIVTGIGSSWTSASLFNLGQMGSSNSLYVTAGGRVYGSNSYIGYVGLSSNNTVLVSDAGSAWHSLSLYVGYVGAGGDVLTVSNGGAVYAAASCLGLDNNDAVWVGGPGSAWVTTNYLDIVGSNNSLVISNGGLVHDSTAYVGNNPMGPNNTVWVSGRGSVWTNSGALYVGYYGLKNSLVVSNGGLVSDSGGFIGCNANCNSNSVLVTGPGSVWTNSALSVTVGDGGADNSLTISNGGAVYSPSGYVGGDGASNTVFVGGNGATWRISNTLEIGGFGGGTRLTIGAGGTVLAFSASISGTDDNAAVRLQGGSLLLSSNLTLYSQTSLRGWGTVTGNVMVNSNGAIVTDSGGTLTINGSLTNSGTIWLMNGSVLQVSGPVVNNGTIEFVNGGGSTSFPGGFTNNGAIVTNTVAISSIKWPQSNSIVQVPSIPGLSYQLQFSSTLQPPSWTNSNSPFSNNWQMGTGGTLNFTDLSLVTPNQPLPRRYYRVQATVR
jgi:fibronectin-binding autotransporter adhesin